MTYIVSSGALNSTHSFVVIIIQVIYCPTFYEPDRPGFMANKNKNKQKLKNLIMAC